MQNLKYDTNELIWKTETDSPTLRTDLWVPRGREIEEGLGVWGEQRQTVLYRIKSKVLLDSMGNYLRCPVINHNTRKEKNMNKNEYIYMAKLLCYIAETDNIVNQLYFKKIKISKKAFSLSKKRGLKTNNWKVEGGRVKLERWDPEAGLGEQVSSLGYYPESSAPVCGLGKLVEREDWEGPSTNEVHSCFGFWLPHLLLLETKLESEKDTDLMRVFSALFSF